MRYSLFAIRYSLILILIVTSCSHAERDAQALLSMAREAYAAGQYNEAKLLIDSIKHAYPKAFDARREGIRLRREVELSEQRRTVAYLDSLLAAQQLRLDSLRPAYVYERDTAYQSTGRYLHPAQVLERNLHRSYLRFQTDDNGTLSLTTIYCGSTPIHHTAVQVTAPDGTFARTPIAPDAYETTVLGEHIETADYRRGSDGDVVAFVCLNADRNLKVAYTGDRTYATTMLPTDRQAAVAVSRLSDLLSAMADARARLEEAKRRIAFYEQQTNDEE